MNRTIKHRLAISLIPIALLSFTFGFALTNAANAHPTIKVEPIKKQAGQSTDGDKQLWCTYQGKEGPGAGKHIALISGDDEYRSEQTMPMLGKILAVRYGFKCTMLFAIDPSSGTTKPNHQTNIPGMEAIDDADLLILGLRFRALPDKQMKQFCGLFGCGQADDRNLHNDPRVQL